MRSLHESAALDACCNSCTETVLKLVAFGQGAAEALQAAQNQAAQQQVETSEVAEAQQAHDEALQDLQEVLVQVRGGKHQAGCGIICMKDGWPASSNSSENMC